MSQNKKLVPPAYFAVAIVMIAILHFLIPIWKMTIPLRIPLCMLLFIVGGCVGYSANNAFKKASISFKHLKKPETLMTLGIYRLSRNPMYLAMVLMLVGVAVLFGSISALIPIALFIWVIDAQYIRREESFLEEVFGSDYLKYKKNVRKWI